MRTRTIRRQGLALVGALTYRFPVLLPLLEEHLDAYDEPLPHLFMGDIARWVIDQFSRHPSDPTWRDVLTFLEVSYETASDDEQELVAVSFLENLPRVGEDNDGIRDLIGPAMKEQLLKFG